MSDGTNADGNAGGGSTVSNDGAGTVPPDNAGSSAGNSSGTHSAPPPPTVQMPDFGPVMTAISALPEQIAKSVREAVGTPAKPPAPEKPAESGSNGSNASGGTGGSESTSKPASKPTTGEPGKRRSFADWWVNG